MAHWLNVPVVAKGYLAKAWCVFQIFAVWPHPNPLLRRGIANVLAVARGVIPTNRLRRIEMHPFNVLPLILPDAGYHFFLDDTAGNYIVTFVDHCRLAGSYAADRMAKIYMYAAGYIR